MKTKKIHRGEILKLAVKSSHFNISYLVKRLNISRGTFYNHTNDPELPLERLYEYGKILKHDFSEEIPQMNQFAFEEPEGPYQKPTTFEEALEQRDYWRDKYYRLLEKYHKEVVEKQISK